VRETVRRDPCLPKYIQEQRMFDEVLNKMLDALRAIEPIIIKSGRGKAVE